jgi:outer membrane protein, multidrug efflux system
MTRALVIAALIAVPAVAAAAPAPKKLTLAEAIARAQGNPAARAALEGKRAAEGKLTEARGARWPRGTITGFVAPSPEITCENPDCTRTSPTDVSINIGGIFGGARLELFQPLYTFGKIDAAIDAAGNGVRYSEALADGVAGDMVEQTARAYFGVQLARELVWMLEDGTEQITKGKATLEERLAKGDPEVTVQDRARLETLEAEVLARLAEAREAEAVALAGLRALVGDPGAEPATDPLDAVEVALQPIDGYLEQADAKQPQLRAARAGVAALAGLVSLEKRRYLPDLILVGGFNVARATSVDNPPSAFASDPFNTTGAQLALVARWTVDPGAQRGRVAQAEAERRRAGALLEAAGAATDFAVRQAHIRAQRAAERMKAAQAGEKSARGWLGSVVAADAIGTASAKDLVDASIAYFTLHGRVLQSTYEWNLATVSLRRATGEFTATPGRH